MADPSQGLEGVVKALKQLENEAEDALGTRRRYPPVEAWNPPYCGDIGLKIGVDGTWYYQGSPIGRQRLVRLFGSVLRKDDDGKHYLVTPAEKISIEVEDAPLLAVEMHVAGRGEEQLISFRTNLDDVVNVGGENPIRFDGSLGEGGMKPYVLVRGRLEALVVRSVYYDLMALGVNSMDGDSEKFGVWSGGVFFPICEALSED